MNKRLIKEYNEGVRRGFIRAPYLTWRQSLIRRINILFNENNRTLTDHQIEEYLERASAYEPVGKIIGIATHRRG